MLKAIDRALSSNSQFPDLKSVEFDLKSMKPLAYYHGAFQRVFPNSYERGVLWVRDDNGIYPFHRIMLCLGHSDSDSRPKCSDLSGGCSSLCWPTS